MLSVADRNVIMRRMTVHYKQETAFIIHVVISPSLDTTRKKNTATWQAIPEILSLCHQWFESCLVLCMYTSACFPLQSEVFATRGPST
jgi:hypothetical protein